MMLVSAFCLQPVFTQQSTSIIIPKLPFSGEKGKMSFLLVFHSASAIIVWQTRAPLSRTLTSAQKQKDVYGSR